MASIGRVLKIGCLLAGALGVLGIGGLVLLAWISDSRPHAPPVPLGAEEQASLDAVLKAAGVLEKDLRPVGRLARTDLEANHRSIAIEGGHVRLLSLRNTAMAEAPAFAAFPKLEQLVLARCGLSTLPDLSACTALQELDLSGNRIAALEASRLPPNLRKLDLSGNPLVDLASLAGLAACRELSIREARVADFSPLIDLPLEMLDLRDNALLIRMPDRLPKSPDFRVDLAGCPVTSPPGYLDTWSFKISQAGVVGRRQTSEGLVTRGAFEARGTWEIVPQLTTVELPTSPNALGSRGGAVNLETSVRRGRLRVYLGTAIDPRGVWFEKGYVKGTGGFIRRVTKVYADATPGQPARLHGFLESIGEQPFYFYIEPQGTEPVEGMGYRVWAE